MKMEMDEVKSYRRSYRKQERNKTRQMRKYYKKLKAGKQKIIADNCKCLIYSSGMSGPFNEDQKEEDKTNMQRTLKRKGTNQKTNNENVKCTHYCGLMGHARMNSTKCLKNKQFMEQEKK
jgi:hypothetical protein